jgi:hypothetical protein
MCFLFLCVTTFLRKIFAPINIQRVTLEIRPKMHVAPYVKLQFVFGFSQKLEILVKFSDIRFHRNSGFLVVTCRHADGQIWRR